MSNTTIQIHKETKDLLDSLKDKYSLRTYDICVNTLALFILKNDVNPKDDFVGDFRSELINLEKRLLMAMDTAHKKITKDNATLRSWVGGITKDHLIPISKQMDKIVNLGIDNNNSNKIENSKIDNPLNSHILEAEDKEIEEKKSQAEEEKNKYFSKYQSLKSALFSIINNSKIEQGGILSKEKIVIDLPINEWQKFKELL